MMKFSRKRWIGLGVLLTLLAAVALLVRGGTKTNPGQPSAGGGRGVQGNPPVPVVTAAVVQKDIPVYLEGLGTVIAFQTVTVKSRVDGQLTKVAFSEGQEVREGDLLAQVDPRPFEIQLKQAEATLAKDQAQVSQARLLLTRNEELRKENLIAQEQLDEQRATVAQLEAYRMLRFILENCPEDLPLRIKQAFADTVLVDPNWIDMDEVEMVEKFRPDAWRDYREFK